mmetsp:Transcript_12918/g.31668  ORF Transcript_12918/g.31668 Transcript_12918/m.31668 type:complete len:103 (+) Transcript_12918:54-362(+)
MVANFVTFGKLLTSIVTLRVSDRTFSHLSFDRIACASHACLLWCESLDLIFHFEMAITTFLDNRVIPVCSGQERRRVYINTIRSVLTEETLEEHVTWAILVN